MPKVGHLAFGDYDALMAHLKGELLKTNVAMRRSERERIHNIFSTFREHSPCPRTELSFSNPFTLLVAVVLSAQSTDAGVNKATARLFALADSAAKMVALGEAAILETIKSIGLYRTKAKNVLALSIILVDRYAGIVPQNRVDLESLPGVGRKTANVVLNTAFGQPTMGVDTHIFRVSNRIPLAKGNNPLEVEFGLDRIIPKEFILHAHHWLILHGRYICKARHPLCERCNIYNFCRAIEKRQRVKNRS